MSSCVKPKEQTEANPVVLLHGFDSSRLEWRYTFPMLEEAGLETWAVDILGWDFSDVASKRDHLYQGTISNFHRSSSVNWFIFCNMLKLANQVLQAQMQKLLPTV
ncbi:alpha/beta hydrolase domain-containing protein VTE7-like [Lycium barbarum]|uniref:alpha/beta hydrolase domain-containing protein VTE7-like n=1 Tax=Lycium barbarum TaxID=112863 RepID=UPI00293E40B5|nr:alpha/beta hydrolase domain-containing protein VTE7-like [Lycium barbarum]XP_060182633.1 alpha/beta hydrolase domain-containing protein VTE7-like [Lycium barbarum]